ncbi:MAG: glycosyltransferase family A protein [Nitrososphaerales archaeon]
MPARNEENYIRQTLDSLLNQTRTPDEIIVVLGRCNDRTPEIVKEYVSKHNIVKVVDKQDSKYGSTFLRAFPIAEAINAGIKQITSDVDFIMIANADSVYSDTYIEEALEIMHREEDCAIVGFKDYASIRGSGAVYRRSFLSKVIGGVFKECAAEDTFMQFAAMGMNYKIIEIRKSKLIFLREPGSGSLLHKIKYAAAQGYASYTLGMSFWYVILRSGFWIMHKKFSAFAIPLGFTYAFFAKAERLDKLFPDAAKNWQKTRIQEELRFISRND